MTDRELLEAAAKAMGYEWSTKIAEKRASLGLTSLWITTPGSVNTAWNPLANDGDALRLAVKLRLSIIHENEYVQGQNIPTIEVIGQEREDGSRDCEMHSLDDDPCAATRRAIVRAAASLAAREAP